MCPSRPPSIFDITFMLVWEMLSQTYTLYVILNIGLARYEQRGSTKKIIDRKGGYATKDEYFKYMKHISAYQQS